MVLHRPAEMSFISVWGVAGLRKTFHVHSSNAAGFRQWCVTRGDFGAGLLQRLGGMLAAFPLSVFLG